MIIIDDLHFHSPLTKPHHDCAAEQRTVYAPRVANFLRAVCASAEAVGHSETRGEMTNKGNSE